MTFRAALEERAKHLGRESLWCGELPTGHALYLAFAEYQHFGDKNHFPSPLHRCAAGLVAAHSRSAGVRTDADDILAAWELADAEIVKLEAEIDHAVAARIPPPTVGAAEHTEGFGAVVSRPAHLYCHSSRVGPVLGRLNPYNGVRLTMNLSPEGPYMALVTGLIAGSVRLPQPTT